MKSLPRSLVRLLGVAFSSICIATAADPAQPVPTATLHNVFQLEEGRLFSGNAPEGEPGFKELQKLGIKTIISVDGSQPNLELAHRFGMRYVHLPFGYDGVPQTRGVELARAAQTAATDGPVYVHCHHGLHRGPAAVAIVCRSLDAWTPEQANDFLKQAGTSPDYAGLYRDVKAFQPPSADQLARLPATYPEATKPAPLVDSMVAIDNHFDDLKAAQKAGWRAIPGHDLQPAQTATLLWESFRELGRDPDTAKRGDDYSAKMAASEKAADALRKVLHDPAADTPTRDTTFQAMTKTCGACHKAHRN